VSDSGREPKGKSGRRSVLVVEDVEDIARMFRFLLEEQDLDVTVVADGISALEAIKKERPDVVVLDLSMPRMNGWEVICLLKKDPRRNDIPILTVSGQRARESALAAGADAYLEKPCSGAALVSEVRRLAALPDVA
jgi:CheY-like chemotaxis protein